MSTRSQRARSAAANGPAIASPRSTPPIPHTRGAESSSTRSRAVITECASSAAASRQMRAATSSEAARSATVRA